MCKHLHFRRALKANHLLCVALHTDLLIKVCVCVGVRERETDL